MRASGPPVGRLPQTWLRAGESNATLMAYEASMSPVHLPAVTEVEPCVRHELTFPEYKSGASPSMLTGLEILEPVERIERSSVAYRATALPLSYIGWSQRGYSKPQPPRYECGALPLELLRHGASAENRTPLIGLAIRCPTNRPHPQSSWSGRR